MRKTINTYHPPIVFHPGETLSERLNELEMGPKEFAVRTGKPEKTIIAILKGDSSITPEMAVQFENVLKIPAHFWLNKQRSYDEFLARNEQQKLLKEAEDWARQFPYADMAKKGWVPETRKAIEKAKYLFSFFAISKHTSWKKYYVEKQLKVAFRISLKHTKQPYAVSAWLRQGELQAEELSVNSYDEKTFKEQLPRFKSLMANEPEGFFDSLQNLCAEAGVKLVYTPSIKSAPINGSTRWLNQTPLIQLSGRYNRNDIFWFTFFHEIGHILLHGKKDIFLEDVKYVEGTKMSSETERKEKEADEFASKWLLSEREEIEIINSAPLNENMIIEFAEKFETNPAVIIGRLQHKKRIHYSKGRNLIRPINLS